MLNSFNRLTVQTFDLKNVFYKNKKRYFNLKKFDNIIYFLFYNKYLITRYFLNNKKTDNLELSCQLICRNFRLGINIPFNIFRSYNNSIHIWCLEDRWHWLEKKKKNDSGDIEISVDNLKVLYRGLGKTDEDAAAIRSNFYVVRTSGFFYYEIKIINAGRNGFIGIGLCSKNVDLDRLPGWEKDSLGYHGDDGNIFKDSGIGIPYGPKFATGDSIGLCWNLVKKIIFFTKNGASLKNAFSNYSSFDNYQMIPVVGLRTPGELIQANFCKFKFEFDINSYIKYESKILIQKSIKLKNPINSKIILENFLFKNKKKSKFFKILLFSIIYLKAEKLNISLIILYDLYFKRRNKMYSKFISITFKERRKIFLKILSKKKISNLIKKNIFDYYSFGDFIKNYIFRSKKTFYTYFKINLFNMFYNIFGLIYLYYNSLKIKLVSNFFKFIYKKFLIFKKNDTNIYKLINIFLNLIIQYIYIKYQLLKIKHLFLESVLVLKIARFDNYDFNLIRSVDVQYNFILFKLWN